MTVSQQSDGITYHIVSAGLTIERSVAAVVSALVRATSHLSPLSLGTAPADPGADQRRREWSDELETHFAAMRRRARQLCPPPMLPQFEDDLTEIEATVRGAITGRVVLFWDLDQHVEQVKGFGRRWVPYIDPPPPRLRCDETDRSVRLDGRVLATELKREEFAFVQMLAARYPDPVPWRTVTNAAPGCRGKNQTRVLNALPAAVRNLIESDATGYALRLPPKLSTGVQTA
ncbi:hypothetical protein GobsT_26130 [Gemmata obscuriglobus]|uniref:Uncharacterized protein n=1 Tax=Gemmata obscuriglobus TaxID=114 RepID=A0A2Z3H2N1_9BACT|nr:hypothetical protein [Gemmata obscuriglobus]AWM39111.1 hypothetical protein C1280_20400 [Gemmata obscuriglobus]QEG27849.1 hypothetical protein GobsT_26130 [Gemmata obscuriglobus]VTS05224.1 unnamed protein product [Gemmata obscuriglobus UQM 2246]